MAEKPFNLKEMLRFFASRWLHIALFVLLFFLRGNGQDIHFTHYDLAPLYTNPAMTGMFDGDLRAHGLYRNQWSTIPVPFNTLALGFDASLFRSSKTGSQGSGGLYLQQDVAGDSRFQTLGVLVPLAYRFNLEKKKTQIQFSVGMAAGLLHKSFQTDALYYDNQFTGEVFDPGTGGESAIDRLSTTVPDISAGLFLKADIDEKWGVQLGYASAHLVPVEQLFLNQSIALNLQRKNTLTADFGYRFQNARLAAHYFYMEQGPKHQHLFGSSYTLYPEAWEKKQASIRFSAYHRLGDAVIARIGYTTGGFTASMSYDATTSSLRNAPMNYGALEFAAQYIWAKPRVQKTKWKKRCTVF